MIKIKNKKILCYLNDKEELVASGRKISKDIENLEIEISKLDKKERSITDKVMPKDLIDDGEALKKEINDKIEILGKIGKKIEDAKISAIPKDMVELHYKLRNEKEKLERDRNKIALKIQKIKDRVIPMIKKEVLPQLSEYEDIESSEIVDDEVVIKTYDRLEEFKKSFKKRA